MLEILHTSLEERMVNNFVGGYAGAGTRVLQMMFDRAGIWVGPKEHLRESYDTHHTQLEFCRAANSFRDGVEHSSDTFQENFDRFRLSSHNWSVKNGESMWAIPFLHKMFPEATYILVVRNGLDNILNHIPFAELYLEWFFPCNKHRPFWDRRMLFWNGINKLALKEGERCYGDKFLVVRLEDMIWHPEEEGKRIFDHVGFEFDKSYVDFIESQASVGRHRKPCTERKFGQTYEPAKHLESVRGLGKEMLTRFGYA